MAAEAPPDAILLAGPTASGKSDWALALADSIPIEVVSVDSAQVYRGFDIGAAKPDAALRSRLRHHLIDLRDPEHTYSAGEFVEDAVAAIRDVIARGRLPVLVGGTMMYFNALVHGIARLPTADPEVRAAIDARAAREGWAALHAELARVDPAAASRMHPNDAQRIQRALEVFITSGRPLSDWHVGTAPRHGLRLERWALVPGDRAWLHARIERRMEQMMEQGFLAEVERLRARPGLGVGAPSLRAVGYRQLWSHLEGECDRRTAVARAVAATRQLARRQLTWIRSDRGWASLEPNQSGALALWCRDVCRRRAGA